VALGVGDCLTVEAVVLGPGFLDRDAVRGCIFQDGFSFDEFRAFSVVGLVSRAVAVDATSNAGDLARVFLATFFAIWRAVASGGGVAEEPAFFTAKGVWGGEVNSESHC
jgi:hypothetical protein